MTATPRCPYCNAQGFQCLQAQDLGLFLAVYCQKCGAIYGVVSKPQTQPEPKRPKPPPETDDLDLKPLRQPKPAPEQPAPDPDPDNYLSPQKAQMLNMFYGAKGSSSRRRIIYTPGKIKKDD